MKKVGDLRKQLVTIAKLGSALAVLGWDQEVNLPPKAMGIRSEVNSLLAADIHTKFTDPKFVDLVKELSGPENLKKMTADERVIVRETWRDVERAQKLPVEFVEEFTGLTSHAFMAWAEARQKSDFKIFKPMLQKIVDMCIRQADYIGYKGSPYDALLDEYEPGMTTAMLDKLLLPLAKELKTLIGQTNTSRPAGLPKKKYPIALQKKLNTAVSEAIGYDLQVGRIDASPHPFTTSFHPTDVRITTRYAADNFWISLGSVIHEVGHALYEQGLSIKDFGTPLGQSVSLGIHESQSRIWENFVGRSSAFSHYLHPQLQNYFGNLGYDRAQLYLWLNKVEPSLIRVEADEVTYNLHIVLRYEIETALMTKKIKVDDLPDFWNQKIKEYLGLSVPKDSEGVLQDIHWSHGTLGYFPTYTLGNLYAAQLFHKISRDIPQLEKQFAAGEFKPFLKWLRVNIHEQGRRYQPEELIKRVTGESPNSKYLISHLKEKLALQK